MAFNAKNIIIGAAPINITTLDSTDALYTVADPTAESSFATGSNGSIVDGNGDLRSAVVGATIAGKYTNVGFTNNGLQNNRTRQMLCQL